MNVIDTIFKELIENLKNYCDEVESVSYICTIIENFRKRNNKVWLIFKNEFWDKNKIEDDDSVNCDICCENIHNYLAIYNEKTDNVNVICELCFKYNHKYEYFTKIKESFKCIACNIEDNTKLEIKDNNFKFTCNKCNRSWS